MNLPGRHLAELLAGQPSPEALAWLSAGLRRWLLDDGDMPLNRHLRLGTAAKARQTLRDALLRDAAEHLDGGLTRRAERLAALCTDFEARIWPIWKDLPEPPERAGPVLARLWEAKRYGADISLTVRRIFSIIA